MIEGQLVVAPDNLRGFDANRIITPDQAQRLRQKGYSFACRYVRRTTRHDYDLTTGEANTLLDAGLGLMLVQHVAPDKWIPTANTGDSYGTTAAVEASSLGVPPGTMIWCDLEGVDRDNRDRTTVPAQQVIDFCNNWHARVAGAGFNPGLYVGFAPGLSGIQLYSKLRFAHYWGAYNLNGDQHPITRGLQLKQMVARPEDLIPPFTNENFDLDIARADALGGRIHLLTRGWCQ